MNLDKPGRESHTLLDKGFFYGLGSVASALASQHYALYGGASLQAYFCDKLTNGASIDTQREALVKLLRPTSDFDLTYPEGVDLGKLLGEHDNTKVQYETLSNLEEYELRIGRNGTKRLRIGVTCESTEQPKRTEQFFVTCHNDDFAHPEMMREAKKLHLLYDPLQLGVRVAPVEYTIAGKFARLSLHRDVPDLVNALTLLDVDLKKVEHLLARRRKVEDHVAQILTEVRKANGDKKYLIRYLTPYLNPCA
jgi:hypothetical protein